MDADTRRWLDLQMETYRTVIGNYKTLSQTTAQILERICQKVAPGARVSGRAKTEFSFAEKILRKRPKYGDEPFAHLRDLAGARAVVYTLDDVRAVCRAIEKADGHGLCIDWANSLDERRALGTDRFRYAGIHYVVEVTGETLFGIDPPFEVRQTPRSRHFVEMQVCTFLEHVWAAIGHDRVYKAELEPPVALERELNAVSALLESADHAFARAIHDLDAYGNDFDAEVSAKSLEDKIDTWAAVAEQCPGSHASAYELGKRLLAAERWQEAFKTLDTIKDVPGSHDPDQWETDHRIKLALARAAIRCGKVERGRELLGQIISDGDENTNAMALLGTSYLEEGKVAEAGRWLEEAFNLRADDPAVLSPYLEFLLLRPGNLLPQNLGVLQGTLKSAIHRCQEYESRRVCLPEAHFFRGRFRLLLGSAYQPTAKTDGNEPDYLYAALSAYCRAIVASRTCTPIADELGAIERIVKNRCEQGFNADDPSHHSGLCESSDWEGLELVRMLLRVALVAKSWQRLNDAQQRAREAEQAALNFDTKGDKAHAEEKRMQAKSLSEAAAQIKKELEDHRQRLRPLLTHPIADGACEPAEWPIPIVIVAGGCDKEYGPKLVDQYGKTFTDAFAHFSGTVIGGGTTAGVSGMVANLVGYSGSITKIGYLPPEAELPRGDTPAREYALRCTFGRSKLQDKAGSREYSKSGPIQSWADLLHNPRINPAKIRLLGIDGGKISLFEFRLAVAMGATVGVVVDSQRAVKTLLEDQTWKEPEGLTPLPTDAATWAAFLRSASPKLDELPSGDVDKAACFVHEQYRTGPGTQANSKKHHPSVLPWDKGLPREYRDSNRHQVRYARLILQDAGYDVIPAEKPLDCDNPPIPDGYEKKIERMAELEHGRFCAERLAQGWRYGPENDLDKKTNPTLIPWNDPRLEPDKIYDREVVANYPKWLARAGLIIVKK